MFLLMVSKYQEKLRIGDVSQYTSHEGTGNVFHFLVSPFTELMAKLDEAANASAEAEE